MNGKSVRKAALADRSGARSILDLGEWKSTEFSIECECPGLYCRAGNTAPCAARSLCSYHGYTVWWDVCLHCGMPSDRRELNYNVAAIGDRLRAIGNHAQAINYRADIVGISVEVQLGLEQPRPGGVDQAPCRPCGGK